PDNKQSGSQSRTYSFADLTPPVLVSFSPPTGSTIDINTDKLILTFNENIGRSSTTLSPGSSRRRLYIYDATTDAEVINIERNSFIADGTSPVAEVPIPAGTLQPHSSYYVVIGDAAISDAPAGNDWPGISDPSVWTFSTSGVTIASPTTNICSGSFEFVGDIVISETG